MLVSHFRCLIFLTIIFCFVHKANHLSPSQNLRYLFLSLHFNKITYKMNERLGKLNLNSCNLTTHFIHNCDSKSTTLSPHHIHLHHHTCPVHALSATRPSLNLKYHNSIKLNKASPPNETSKSILPAFQIKRFTIRLECQRKIL